MLIDDFLRELWLNGPEWMGGVILVYTILTVSALGSVFYCGLSKHEDRDGLWAAVVTFSALLVVILLFGFVPTSPLIGITGHVFPSPWAHGLYTCLCFTVILTSMVYGLVSGTVHSLKDMLNLICYGISRWSWVIPVSMIISLFITLF